MIVRLINVSNKGDYPNLGLMKIAAYHKSKGDDVGFLAPGDTTADKIYISVIFTYDFSKAVNEIIKALKITSNVFIGGPAVTLIPDKFKMVPGLSERQIIRGDIKNPLVLGENDDQNFNDIIPDYSILNGFNGFYDRLTSGCLNNCAFCSVKRLKPTFEESRNFSARIKTLDMEYGEQKKLILMDDNILQAPNFYNLIDELIKAGFYKGSQRRVDFNQGIDARLLDNGRLDALASVEIRPFRLAFDSLSLAEIYKNAIRAAYAKGIKYFCAYALYNFNDTPAELYNRLKINYELMRELNISIYAYPMRYAPTDRTDRKYTAEGWTRDRLLGVSAILRVSRGVVRVSEAGFNRAFGSSVDEFLHILDMPRESIMGRGWKNEI